MSVLHRLASQAAERNTLFSVLLELTYRCNLDCFFCYNDLGKQGKLLSTERYMSLLEELRDLGVLNLTLSGGEPLAHPSFWEIGKRAGELAFSTRIKTNGHAVGADVAKRLFDEVRPFLVEVSLHGATAPTHDRQTRVPGSFVRLMANIRAMIAARLHVKLNATLTTWNAAEADAMFALADSFGLRLDMTPTVTANDSGDPTPLSISPTREEVSDLIRILERRTAETAAPGGSDPADDLQPGPISQDGAQRRNCALGVSTLTIDPYGDVFPCVQWRKPVGNVLRQRLADIWVGNAKLEQVRRWNEEAAQMVDGLGPAGRAMAFCPAMAERETGSPTGIYPGARVRAEALLGRALDAPLRPIELDPGFPVVPSSTLPQPFAKRK